MRQVLVEMQPRQPFVEIDVPFGHETLWLIEEADV
jgi:hypothetical protein